MSNENNIRKSLEDDVKSRNLNLIGVDLGRLKADAGYLVSTLDKMKEEQMMHSAYIDICDIMIKDMQAIIETIRRRIDVNTHLNTI